MISQRKFSTAFESLWRSLLPMSDQVVRKINSESRRFARPFEGTSPAKSRSFINQLSFLLFCAHTEGALKTYDRIPSQLKKELIARAAGDAAPFVPDAATTTIKKAEVAEARALAKRLSSILTALKANRPIICSPTFSGCGILRSSSGDVAIDNTLYEIKAGKRSFRALDVRQLLTYCVLNYVDQTFRIKRVALLNPRTGLLFESEVGTLVESLTGRSAVEFFSTVVDYLTAEELSQ